MHSLDMPSEKRKIVYQSFFEGITLYIYPIDSRRLNFSYSIEFF